jgi:TonB family protein
MGVVAAMHVGLLYLIANSLGMVPSILENKTEATFIDETPPSDDLLPPPEPVDLTRSDTRVLRMNRLRCSTSWTTPSSARHPRSSIDRSRRAEAPSCSRSSSACRWTRVTRCPSRHILPAKSAQVTRARPTSRSTCCRIGRVGDARIVKSTGFPALDQSALDEAKRKWRLTPATRDGVPFAQWHRLRVTFKLNTQR